MKYKKNLIMAIFIISISSLFSGCFDRREIDDLTYVIGIGFDKGDVEPLRLTVQYAIPTAMSGGGGGDTGGDDKAGAKSLGMVTVETSTIYSGLNMVNNFVGKQLNMSHAKVAVFSEALAKSDGVEAYIHAMTRGREFRPNMVIAVAKGLAEDYLKTIKPKQEINPAKYYELKFSNYKFTGFYSNTALYHFYNKTESYGASAVAAIVGVNDNKNSKEIEAEKTSITSGMSSPMMGDYKAGELPRAGDIKGETLGLAVFDGTKMVGELNGTEATSYLIASGEYKNSYMTFDDPQMMGKFISTNISQSRIPEYKINLDNGKPVIDVNIKLEGDFLSIQSGINYENDPQRTQFETSAEKYFEKEISKFLDKTSQELGCDICSFGKFAKKKFLTNDEWVGFQWLKKYKETKFNVDVDLKIRRPGLMIRSLPPIVS